MNYDPYDDGVFLANDNPKWEELPQRTKKGTLDHIERVRKLRRKLSKNSYPGVMPLIRILPVGWINPAHAGSPVWGRSWVPISAAGVFHMGIEIPLSTVIVTTEDQVMMGHLMHEALHVFFWIERSVAWSKEGNIGPTPHIPQPKGMDDEEYDGILLSTPEEWFKKEYKYLFLSQNAPRTFQYALQFESACKSAGLPLDPFPLKAETTKPMVMDDRIIKHAQKLYERRGRMYKIEGF